MSQTGIVRKIDDLGRIVIPKEIRKTLRIREGDSFQIIVNGEDIITLTKYEPIRSIIIEAENLVELADSVMSYPICITDRENIIAASKIIKEGYLNKRISKGVRQKIEDRMSWSTKQNTAIDILESDSSRLYKSQLIIPIISNTDAIGCVIIFTKESGNIINELDKKMAEKISKILAKEFE